MCILVLQAHNTDAVERLLESVALRFPGQRVVSVFGAHTTKAVGPMLAAVTSVSARVVLVAAAHPSAANTILLEDVCQGLRTAPLSGLRTADHHQGAPGGGGRCVVVPAASVDEGVDAALRAADPTHCHGDSHEDSHAEEPAATRIATTGAQDRRGVVVVCGSFYVVAAARRALAARFPLAFAPDDAALMADTGGMF
jgi:folylpolyglutamate synthase/dihydropteroate synthase